MNTTKFNSPLSLDQTGKEILKIISEEGRNSMGLAAAKGDIEKLDELINGRAERACRADAYGDTPLHLAAIYGQFEAVKFLVRDFAVNMNATNWEGWTPLFGAISRGHIEIADFLIRNGASLVHYTPAGLTVMHIASWYNQPLSVDFLLRKEVDPSIPSAYGIQPITMCRPGPVKRIIYSVCNE